MKASLPPFPPADSTKRADGTSLNLLKPADVALVHRAVVNGWNVPQPMRDKIVRQLAPALDAARQAADSGNPRALGRILRLAKLALLMEARNLITDGVAKSKLPYVRRRGCETRRRRSDSHE